MCTPTPTPSLQLRLERCGSATTTMPSSTLSSIPKKNNCCSFKPPLVPTHNTARNFDICLPKAWQWLRQAVPNPNTANMEYSPYQYYMLLSGRKPGRNSQTLPKNVFYVYITSSSVETKATNIIHVGPGKLKNWPTWHLVSDSFQSKSSH
eukprot:m.147038 g.147038  ORF g.147038 m.147038 type:complete len:150 (+) comp24335_c0_seq2:1384-1833(+)